MKLLIVIPALNEEASIRSIVERSLAARKTIAANSPVTEVEITVVSDGSTDRTVEFARQYEDRVKLIVFEKNRGYGAAIKEAWRQSDADLLGFLDADGTCDPAFFADLCKALVEGRADLALGCRLNPATQMPLMRKIGNRLLSAILRLLSSSSVRDTASGMRVVRRESLPKLLPLPDGLHFTPAMSARALLRGDVRIVELDMPYHEREGKSKFRVSADTPRFLWTILKMSLCYRQSLLRLVLAALVLLLFFGLRLVTIRGQGLWADEVFSLAMATGHSLEHPAAAANAALGDYIEEPGPATAARYRQYLKHERPPAGPSRVVRAVLLSDTSPPLYYLLVYAWTGMAGTSDIALRLFSILWALACLPLLWFLAREVAGRTEAFIACILFTLAPVGIYYSTEARMYSMLWWFSMATVLATMRLHRSGGGIFWYAAWIICNVGGIYTHYFFVFVGAACFEWLLLFPGRLGRGRAVLGAALAALCALPWFLRLPASLSQWRITAGWLNGFPGWGAVPKAWAMQAWSFVSGWGCWGYRAWGAYLAAAAIGFALLILAWRFLFRPRPPQHILLYAWLFAACAGTIVFDALQNTYTCQVPRYALAGMPAAFLLVAVAWGSIRWWGRLIALALLLAAWSPNISAILSSHSRGNEPYRRVAKSIERRKQPDDLVIVHSIPSGVLGIARYLPLETPLASWVGQLRRRQVPRDIESLVAGWTGVILVKIHEVNEPAPEETWLKQNARLTAEVWKETAQTLYFAPPHGDRFAAPITAQKPAPPSPD